MTNVDRSVFADFWVRKSGYAQVLSWDLYSPFTFGINGTVEGPSVIGMPSLTLQKYSNFVIVDIVARDSAGMWLAATGIIVGQGTERGTFIFDSFGIREQILYNICQKHPFCFFLR